MSTEVIHGTGTDEDLFQDLQFHFAEPCFYIKYGCNADAKWKLTSRCCHATLFLCQEHFDEQLEWLRENNVHCDWCRHIWIPGTQWILKVEPVEKK